MAAIKDEAGRIKWKQSRKRCYFCGKPKARCWPALDTMHIIGGHGGRSDEPTNLVAGCPQCHGASDGRVTHDEQGKRMPPLSLGMILQVKMFKDHLEYDPDRLAELHGKALPELEPLPAYYVEEYRKHMEATYDDE